MFLEVSGVIVHSEWSFRLYESWNGGPEWGKENS